MNYIPSRFFIFIITLVSLICIWMIYQVIITSRLEKQIENFDPYPYSNTYFPPEDRLQGSTEVLAKPDNVASIEFRNTSSTGLGSALRQVNFSYRVVDIPKLAPKVNLRVSSVNQNQPSLATISFQLPEQTTRSTRSVEAPNLLTPYLIYVPLRWSYFQGEPNDIQTKSLIIADLTNAQQTYSTWLGERQFVNGDYLLHFTQGGNTTPMKYELSKRVKNNWTIVETRTETNPLSSVINKVFDLTFTNDIARRNYVPSSNSDYDEFSQALTNFNNRTQLMKQNLNRKIILSCPYAYYPQPGSPATQGFLLSGYNIGTQRTPASSNLNSSSIPINTAQIPTNGWALTQSPVASAVSTNNPARMGGFLLSSPLLLLQGRVFFTIPGAVLGQRRIKSFKLKATSTGRFSLRIFGSASKLIDLQEGGNAEATITLRTPGEAQTWNFIFEWEEIKNGQNMSFDIKYKTKDQTDQETTYEIVPSSMLSVPEPYYLTFNSSGTQKDSAVYLSKALPTIYRPDALLPEMTGNIEYIPKIEWEIEPLTAPLDSSWSMTGETETAVLSSMVRIRSTPKNQNDAIYYLTVNPSTAELTVSLDGGGFQSGWFLEPTPNNMVKIKSGYDIPKKYLCYQSLQKPDGDTYLLRSNVLLGETPCPWNILPIVEP